ncbi:MAG: hypothetical protein C5S38_06130 [Candidatus Methanophagaceae archaeon]|nr:MAG: hypothetical protein C5S38_06130 [Methanophagales archaeon]
MNSTTPIIIPNVLFLRFVLLVERKITKVIL